MKDSDKKKLVKAGEIAKETVAYARSIVKKDMLLIEIAELIEDKIVELGGQPAFPVNLSINEIAAHATPSFNDEAVAKGLLKVDIGVHIDGWIADTAFSVDLENLELNRKLIASAESALKAGVKEIGNDVSLNDIGKAIEHEIKHAGFVPVHNLTGHGIEQYDVHAGVGIPNFANGSNEKIEEGIYAIEPFSTNGAGKVVDGKPSGIYQLVKVSNVRDSVARELIGFISENYGELPFASRWIYEEFGARGLIGLRFLEQAGVLYQYAQLVEQGKGIVAQAENTLLIGKEKEIIA